MADLWDVAIVGGGHNGLVAAAYLARAGRRVVVLERRSQVGGAAATEEIAPGFRASTGASLCGLLRPEIVRDLGLGARGLEFLPLDPEVVAIGEDGKSLALFRDVATSQESIRAMSAGDAAVYGRFVAMVTQLASVLDPLLLRTPPDLSAVGLGEQLFFLRRGLKLRRLGKDAMGQALRFPPMSLHAFLGEWFESDLLKACIAFDALLGSFRGPRSPGTAFGLIHHYLALADGGSWALVRGGMGRLAMALADAARAAGAVIRTDAEVRRIVVQDGRAEGVELASGEIVPARDVASNADPQRTFLGLVDPAELEPSFVSAIRAYRATGILTKVNLALDSLPRFAPAADGRPPVHFRIAPTLDHIERAYDDAKYGKASAEPALDVLVPSLADPSLAPSGKHVMSVVVQYTPHRLRGGDWDKSREALGDKVLELLEGPLPGLGTLVLRREVLTPPDLEARFGLTGGHIYHGEMSLDQQYVLRPVAGWGRYRTPIDGLWLCGSGAHPGGGITGAPGYNAAREILRARAGFRTRPSQS